jgi:glycogen(starch) synthase
MRVLHLTPEYPPVIWGGLGTAVGGLVTASAHAGILVGVLLVGGVLLVDEMNYGSPWQPVSVEHFMSDQPVVDSEGVIFFHVAAADAIEAGIRLVRTWKPDVIHLHTAWLWPVAHAIEEQTGTPIVFTVHSLDRAEYQIGQIPVHWEAQEVVIAAATRIIALSRSERELLAQYCPTSRDRVRIVGNGIDDNTTARAVAHFTDRNDPPLVLYTGRFVERKGIRELLAAIPQVLERMPTARFVLVGGYGSGAEIERDWLFDSLRPWQSQIHFTGWLPPQAVAWWYCVADILVVPSWYEPFGMVILEGMLYGLAIAASAIGGPAEILEHGRTGLLFPPQDVGALATAVLRLLTDTSLRRRLSAAAADEVRNKWLWLHIVEKMRRVYREAMQARSRKIRQTAL